MRHIVIVIISGIALFTGSFHDTAVQAGGYDHGKATGSCSITPSPALVGQPYTVTVSGLSLDTPDYLFILPPNSAGYNGALDSKTSSKL